MAISMLVHVWRHVLPNSSTNRQGGQSKVMRHAARVLQLLALLDPI
jgi:hypothetical protein